MSQLIEAVLARVQAKLMRQKKKKNPKKKSEIEVYVTFMSQSRGEKSRTSREALLHKVIQGVRFFLFCFSTIPRMLSLSVLPPW